MEKTVSLLPDIFVSKNVVTKERETLPGKILIITSCTKDKAIPKSVSPQQQLQPDDLWDEKTDDRTKRDFGSLEQYRVKAGKLYQGRQHIQLMKGVDILRQAFGHAVVDVKIISAGFGLVDEEQPLPPYNATFADQPSAKILTIAQRLGIPQAMNQLVQKEYDCAFFLLGENYLLSIGLPFAHTPSFPCLFLAGPSSHKRIPRRAPYQFVRVGQDDSVAFSYNLVGLKGHLFKLFANQIIDPDPRTTSTLLNREASDAERLKHFFANPTSECFREIVEPFCQSDRISKAQQAKSQAFQAPLLYLTNASEEIPPAKNYHLPMRYFIPDWEDLVDPHYDFETDTGTPEKRKYYDEVYAHEIYKHPNYDGILFSKSAIEKSQAKSEMIREIGSIHKYARFENRPILGDCGAFSYIAEKDPPYETKEILDYYQNYGFDYGVSIDHLIIPAFYHEKEYRYHLTQENAREFIKLHREGGYSFTPVGVAQGWTPETYKRAAEDLLECGYKYIALGGLARAKTEDIIEILKAIRPILQEDTDLHLFGVARDRENTEMKLFRQLGVTSFDSASYLRRAWMSATHNYFTEDGERYAALRISPVYPTSPRVKKILAEGLATFEELQKLEKDALQAVRAYDKGQLKLEETLNILLEIDRIEEYNYDQHLLLYRRVLEDQPWKKCKCEICRALGIEVIIFRGNDRNRRRGFHNTYVFYKRFRESLKSR
jgi:hypothetical protein